MKWVLAVFVLLNHLAISAPAKVEGTFDQYSRADQIAVYYLEKEAAIKACEREGLKIVREDSDLKFFVTTFRNRGNFQTYSPWLLKIQ